MTFQQQRSSDNVNRKFLIDRLYRHLIQKTQQIIIGIDPWSQSIMQNKKDSISNWKVKTSFVVCLLFPKIKEIRKRDLLQL